MSTFMSGPGLGGGGGTAVNEEAAVLICMEDLGYGRAGIKQLSTRKHKL